MTDTPRKKLTIEAQVLHLKELRPNWDGYGASPIPHERIDQMAREIEEDEGLAQIIPGGDGSLQAEWHLEGRTTVEYNIENNGDHSIYVSHVPASSEAAVLIEDRDTTIAHLKQSRARVEARLEAAEAEIARMREALEPFAEQGAELFNDWCPDETAAWYYSNDGFDAASPVTVGDFRRARAALSKPPVET